MTSSVLRDIGIYDTWVDPPDYRERIRKLEKALEPFAKFTWPLAAEMGLQKRKVIYASDSGTGMTELTVQDFKRARRALGRPIPKNILLEMRKKNGSQKNPAQIGKQRNRPR